MQRGSGHEEGLEDPLGVKMGMNHVSPQGQKLHSHCRFSAEVYPEESIGQIEAGSLAKNDTFRASRRFKSFCLNMYMFTAHTCNYVGLGSLFRGYILINTKSSDSIMEN